MPAPTALQRRPEELIDNVTEDISMEASAVPLPEDNDAELIGMDIEPDVAPAFTPEAPTEDTPMTDESGRPRFAPAKSIPLAFRREQRKVPIPPHRMTPLKTAWPKMYPPLVEHLKLQVRTNIKAKAVELRTSNATTDTGALQKGEVRSICLHVILEEGTNIIVGLRTRVLSRLRRRRRDRIAPTRRPLHTNLWYAHFLSTTQVTELTTLAEIKDVKNLQGEHLGRAIGRIAGKDGKTRFAIENASRTRIVLADQKIHILGGFKNITIARESIVSLILGQNPSKVYGNLRTVAGRMKERF